MTPEQNATNHEVKTELKKYDVLEVDITAAAQKYFGGKKRSELKDSDFLFPKTRSLPIATPDDVPDAVSNFGRMSGNMSYEEFKKKLVSFVKNKGAKFVAALPKTIKEEFDLADATQIAVFPDKYVDPKDVGPTEIYACLVTHGLSAIANEVEREVFFQIHGPAR